MITIDQIQPPKSEVSTELAEAIKATPPEPPQPPQPSFSGELVIKFPTTNQEFSFRPQATERGKLEDRWSYPSLSPELAKLATPQERLDKLTHLCGLDAVVDAVELQYNKLAQDRWKLATAKELDPVKQSAKFAEMWFAGKQEREAVSEASFDKKYKEAMKAATDLRAKSGGVITEEVKALYAQAKQFLVLKQELALKAMLELEKLV